MSIVYLNRKRPALPEIFVSVVGGDLVGEMTPIEGLDKYKGRKRYLSLADRNNLRAILTASNKEYLVPDPRGTTKFVYDPSSLTAKLVDSTRATQTIVIAWTSRLQYFRTRGYYLGYPTCCVDYHVRNLKTGGKVEPAPIGMIRCPKHQDVAVEDYVSLINENRWHPQPQRLKGGIPFPTDFFLHLTALGLQRFRTQAP